MSVCRATAASLGGPTGHDEQREMDRRDLLIGSLVLGLTLRGGLAVSVWAQLTLTRRERPHESAPDQQVA